MKTPNQAFIETLDSDDYDTEAMLIDDSNGNFSPDNTEDYRVENIVIASLLNGQFTQAKEQCASFGLNYNEMRLNAGMNPFPA
jgi:hypothetical protein